MIEKHHIKSNSKIDGKVQINPNNKANLNNSDDIISLKISENLVDQVLIKESMDLITGIELKNNGKGNQLTNNDGNNEILSNNNIYKSDTKRKSKNNQDVISISNEKFLETFIDTKIPLIDQNTKIVAKIPSQSSIIYSKSFYKGTSITELAYRNDKKTRLFKTEMCRSFTELGTCKYGDNCQFSHNKDELRQINRHPKYKTEICRVFWQKGTCPYGRRCCFIHKSKNVENSKFENVSTSTIPLISQNDKMAIEIKDQEEYFCNHGEDDISLSSNLQFTNKNSSNSDNNNNNNFNEVEIVDVENIKENSSEGKKSLLSNILGVPNIEKYLKTQSEYITVDYLYCNAPDASFRPMTLESEYNTYTPIIKRYDQENEVWGVASDVFISE